MEKSKSNSKEIKTSLSDSKKKVNTLLVAQKNSEVSLRASQEKIAFMKKRLQEKLDDAVELGAQVGTLSERSQQFVQLEEEVERTERTWKSSLREQDSAKHELDMLKKEVEELGAQHAALEASEGRAAS